VVLLVDDQSDVRLAYRLLLEAAGFVVLEASDGSDALARIEKHYVDVVVTDIYMPGVDGISLINMLRHEPGPRVGIIAMSGEPHLAYRSSLQAARHLGADALFVKPMEGPDLIRTIHSLVDGGPVAQESTR
jgi:CheY-like chemotaxis protein